MLLTIQTSNEHVPAGTYQATFQAIENIETERGKAYRWVFRSSKGQTISGLSDAERPPTPKNKTGRWLSALSGLPLQSGIAVNTDDYIGKQYLCIVQASENGGTRLETISALAV